LIYLKNFTRKSLEQHKQHRPIRLNRRKRSQHLSHQPSS